VDAPKLGDDVTASTQDATDGARPAAGGAAAHAAVQQPPATCHLLLTAPMTLRQLELMADSLLGQTDPDWLLHAPASVLGAACADLLRRYADRRLCVTQDGFSAADISRDELASIVPPGAVYLPTWLAQLRALLAANPGAPVAACAASLFDGTVLASAAASTAGAIYRAGVTPADPAFTLPAGTALHASSLIVLRAPGPPTPAQRRLPMHLFGVAYRPAELEAERPPTLHIVVDTEAEFDWQGDFDANLNAISAISAIETGQAIFDRYGLRPVYLIDYPVAAQPEGVAAVGAMARRGACAVGAHLHPWTNPPFTRPIDRRLSFPGNLPAEEEAAKLNALAEVIGANFGERPLFYKAGRYGLGPNTARLIAAAGVRVDFSLMPETDLRDRGGPDFRAVATIPYDVPELGLLAMPMTRANLGPLSRSWKLRQFLDTRSAGMPVLRGVLSRTGLMERLTLTPEGVPLQSQLVLLKTLLQRGHRSFVMHYHSPSLAVGHTEYVPTEERRVDFLSRIETICRWFFEELGGLPGRPWDLLPIPERSRLDRP
jgi:hypothetical protein